MTETAQKYLADQAPAPQAFTVDEFCLANRFSRAHFYNLLKAGRAPKIFKVGSLTRISSEAATEWRRQLEAVAAAGSSGRTTGEEA